MKAITKVLAGAIIALGMTGAHADQITGAFSISGAVAPLPAGTMDAATGLDFMGAIDANSCTGDILTAVGGNSATCNNAVGSILDLAAGTIVGSGAVNLAVNLNDWIALNLGGVRFDLSTITLIERTGGVLPALEISGTGTMQATGFDDTAGFFRLTTQGGGGSFSFSSTQISTAVPEPGSLALLGLALGGLALVRRRK